LHIDRYNYRNNGSLNRRNSYIHILNIRLGYSNLRLWRYLELVLMHHQQCEPT
jgi:hypothetical protein